MKLLICTTSTNNVDVVLGSLAFLNQHEIRVLQYDANWNQLVPLVIAESGGINGEVGQMLQNVPISMWPAEYHEAWKPRCRMDEDILAAAKEFQPDLIFYISAWEGLFVPEDATLGELNSIAPLTHICFDGADPPWWPQMRRFENADLFSLTLNIDGSEAWPGGRDWGPDHFGVDPWKIRGLTLLTPVDPRFFVMDAVGKPLVRPPFQQRPYAVAYAGNTGGWLRGCIGQKLVTKGIAVKQRDNNPGSYGHYAQFLTQCKAVISVPFTGSTAAAHVKGRVLEAGWAGATVLEWRNPATRRWFYPRAEYWEYNSVENLLEEIDFLTGHPEMVEEMARALSFRVQTEHNPVVFWKKVFEALGKDPAAVSDVSSLQPAA